MLGGQGAGPSGPQAHRQEEGETSPCWAAREQGLQGPRPTVRKKEKREVS